MTKPQERRPRWGLWIALALFVSIASIIVLGQVRVEGVPLIESPSTIIVQIVASSALVLAAALPLLRRAERNSATAAVASKSAAADAAEARDQVTNAHTTNLREESDDRHTELTEGLGRALAILEEVQAEQKRQRVDVRRVEGTVRGAQRDIGRVSDMVVSVSNRQNVLGERQVLLDDKFHEAIDALKDRRSTLPHERLAQITSAPAPATDHEGEPHG